MICNIFVAIKQTVARIPNPPRAWLRHTPYLRTTRNFQSNV